MRAAAAALWLSYAPGWRMASMASRCDISRLSAAGAVRATPALALGARHGPQPVLWKQAPACVLRGSTRGHP